MTKLDKAVELLKTYMKPRYVSGGYGYDDKWKMPFHMLVDSDEDGMACEAEELPIWWVFRKCLEDKNEVRFNREYKWLFLTSAPAVDFNLVWWAIRIDLPSNELRANRPVLIWRPGVDEPLFKNGETHMHSMLFNSLPLEYRLRVIDFFCEPLLVEPTSASEE